MSEVRKVHLIIAFFVCANLTIWSLKEFLS